MIQLAPISIDDKALYSSIAIKKHIKNSHCSTCQNKSACETCTYSERFKMQSMAEYIFSRYDYYLTHRNNLNAIVSEKKIVKDKEDILRDSYKNSTDFKRVRKTIMDNLPIGMQGKCPFCMISEPNTLEHYFPKALFPEYIIFTPNLVPCCSQCNTLKGEEILKDGYRTTLHYYFDQIPTEKFIFASIAMDAGIPVVSFDIKTDGFGEIGLIILNQFKTLELINRYRKQCNDELSNLHSEMLESYKGNNSVEACINFLTIRINSLQKKYGKNYWKACLYEALASDKNIFQEFLTSIMVPRK